MQRFDAQQFEEITISLDKFVGLKPFQDQEGANGVSLINENRAIQYAKSPHLAEMLNSVTNPITLTRDNRVLQGNHRRAAAQIRQALPNALDPNLTIVVRRLTTDVDASRLSATAYMANAANANDNYRNLLFNSKMGISVQVMKPTLEAVQMSNPKLTKAQVEQLAQRLGAILNNNPILVSYLKRGETILPVTLKDFVDVRYQPEGNKNFYLASPNVDVRTIQSELAEALRVGSDIIVKLTQENTLKEKGYKTTGRSTLLYLIISWGLQGVFSSSGRSKNKLNAGKFLTVLRNKSVRVQNAVQQMYSDPEGSEDTMRCIMQEATDVNMETA